MRAFRIGLAVCVVAMTLAGGRAIAADGAKVEKFKGKIEHVVVIYQENWSFDGLYPTFPGADPLPHDGKCVTQKTWDGHDYVELPPVLRDGVIDRRFPIGLPNRPFNLAPFVNGDDFTGDLVHRFYQEQWQIDADPKTGQGRMDKFVAWADAGSLTMSFCDATNMPAGKLAQEFTMCDHFFHAGFGGSFFNHMTFVSTLPQQWPGWAQLTAQEREALVIHADPLHFKDGRVTEDGYAVNTAYGKFAPHPPTPVKELMDPLTTPTIGDLLSDASPAVSWKWYSGGWADAAAGKAANDFQYHHQPFAYFGNFWGPNPKHPGHLCDETELYIDIEKGQLPQVTFVKFLGRDNEHPQYASVLRGQQHTAELVERIRKSAYWDKTMIVITYDENGGRWDHVPPPKVDQFGPGSRIPCIVISPFAKRHYVDHTEYDTLSVIQLIEKRFGLGTVTPQARELKFSDLLETMDFDQAPAK